MELQITEAGVINLLALLGLISQLILVSHEVNQLLRAGLCVWSV